MTRVLFICVSVEVACGTARRPKRAGRRHFYAKARPRVNLKIFRARFRRWRQTPRAASGECARNGFEPELAEPLAVNFSDDLRHPPALLDPLAQEAADDLRLER